MSIRISRPVVKVFGGIAVLFGIATLVSGADALFVSHKIADPAANIVPFVLYFNFAAGFAYIVAGAGLLRQRPWAPALSAAIAAATTLVFAGLVAWIFAGNAYAMRTVAAMSLRTAFWLSVSAISIRGSRSGTALQLKRNDLSSNRTASNDQSRMRQINDNQRPNG